MTTYLIYPDANDGFIKSNSTSYASMLAGSNLTMDTTGANIRVGQNKSTSGIFIAYQSFISFDTSVIADAEEIVDATLNAHMGFTSNQTAVWDMEFRQHSWIAPLDTTQWKTQSVLKTYPVHTAFNVLTPSSAYRTIATGGDSLVAAIDKTAAMKFVAVSSRNVAGNAPSGTEELLIGGGNAVGKPYLKISTVALNTLNAVSEASTTLPDGTTVSIRSNGTATNTLSVGYNTLSSSTWTSISTLDSSLQQNIDGSNSVTITSDPDGNFYVFGQRLNTPGYLFGQAFVKTGPTTWEAKTPLTQALPTGNGQTIRSISAQYMKGGSDVSDKPSIFILLSRGASGVKSAYRYHTSGTGYVHNAQIKPESLLAGTGTLINAASGFKPAESAVPVFVDTTPVGSNLNACYVQRGNVHGKIVGGIAMLETYNQSGKFTAFNTDYISTGASQLVSISDKMFAHVFDSEGIRLSVRFYNAQAQLLGEATIPKESFYGGVIGSQFAAYYDKTSDLVRVFFVSVTGSRVLDRFDVSPVTFIGTTVLNVTTTLGATGAINSDLRVSRTTDERRVMLEAASVAAGVHSVATTYTTVGNKAPSAPSLTVRSNFDATSPATFTWKFGDANPADTQTAYELEISRVSDSVVVHTTGKVTSTLSSRTLAANVLTNGVAYRWRVRTYDVIGATGTWSGYGTFSTAATGTLTITSPTPDNQAGIETDDWLVTWSYVQSADQTQAQRQVKVVRTSDGVVLSDTGMQANTTLSHTISGMESGREYRIEVSIINSASITVPAVTRLITPFYSEPMTPEVQLVNGDSYIEVAISNPTPTGDRPEVIFNDIYRRRMKANSVDSDYIRIATVENSVAYKDYAVKSGTAYEYYVVGRTA